jgi:uncharacterized OsmC-like protein
MHHAPNGKLFRILAGGTAAAKHGGTNPSRRVTAMNAATAKPQPAPRTPPAPRNGVDTPTLAATLDVVRGQRELAKFQFRARNRWIAGTHSRTTMESFSGAGGEHQHIREYAYDGDHPKVLCGADSGPTPVEFLLHALATCLTAGIANIASMRGVTLTEVESTVEGDIDLQGIFGMSEEVRNGYQQIRIGFKIKGDAPPEKLRQIVEQSRARSAVFDVLTNGVPVALDIDVA